MLHRLGVFHALCNVQCISCCLQSLLTIWTALAKLLLSSCSTPLSVLVILLTRALVDCRRADAHNAQRPAIHCKQQATISRISQLSNWCLAAITGSSRSFSCCCRCCCRATGGTDSAEVCRSWAVGFTKQPAALEAQQVSWRDVEQALETSLLNVWLRSKLGTCCATALYKQLQGVMRLIILHFVTAIGLPWSAAAIVELMAGRG